MSNQDVGGIVKYFRDNWNYVVEVGLVVATTVSTFLLAPPDSIGGVSWFNYGRFLITLAVALCIVPTVMWHNPKYAKRWWISAFSLCVVGVIVFWNYADRLDRWTAPFPYPADEFEMVVVGETLLPVAQRRVQSIQDEGQSYTPSDLLMAGGGEARRIWVADEIKERAQTLAVLYLVSLMVFGGAMIFAVHASHCLVKKKQA